MAGNVLSDAAVAQIRQLFRDFYAEIRQGQQRPGGRGNQRNLWVVLDEDLYAAADSVNSVSQPTTAIGSVQAINSDGDMYDTGEKVTVVNRFEFIAIQAGTLIAVEWLNGEWSPYKSDCQNPSSSGVPASQLPSGSIGV